MQCSATTDSNDAMMHVLGSTKLNANCLNVYCYISQYQKLNNTNPQSHIT